MLDALRRGATGWIAKIFLFLLVISFAIWGVADVFRGYGRGSLAQVGKTEITADEFQQAFRAEIDRMSRMFGRQLTVEQARQFGLETTVLTRLVDGAVIDEHAQSLNLALSDDVIAEGIKRTAMFKGLDGKFSRLQFDEVLRQNGLSEGRYMASKRKGEVREHLTGAMIGEAQPPAPLIELLHKFREETRTIQHITLDAEKAVKVDEPDEARLKEHYEQNKAQFMVPEYRKLQVLILSGTEVKKRIPIGEDKLRAAYEQDKDAYSEPERRRVYQLSFADKAAAEKAATDIAKAVAEKKSVLEAARALGVKESDIDLGMVTRRDIIDKAVADAAFALEKNKVSAPVVGQFTTVLLHVADVEAGKQRTYDEVKEQVRDKLANEKAGEEIEELHKKVDDERAASRPFKDIADKLKLEYRDVAAVDRSGNGPDGKPALDHAEAKRIVASAFEGKVGLEGEAIELADGGFMWTDVAGVTPAKQKSLDEAKADVKAAFVEAERRKALSQLAIKLVERLNKGEAMEAVAASLDAKVGKAEAIKRTATPEGLAKRAVDLAFTLARGAAVSAESADGKSRSIVRVDEVKAAELPSKEQAERIAKELSGQLQNDLLQEYVGALKERHGININQLELRRVMGLDRQ